MGKKQWLSYYSQHFSAVEINSTYYGLPKKETVQRWADETPDGFRFMVKVHADTTHKRENDAAEVAELLDLMEPLRLGGKLDGLLAQFPASFHADSASERYLSSLAKWQEEVPLFVEFRHTSWDQDRAIALLNDLKLGYVAVDLPKIRSLMGARPAVCGKLAYVRFHGRNRMTWYDKDAGDRYDWDYTEQELREWLPRIQALDARAEMSYLFFNNCHAGQAIKSAIILREILRQQFEVL
ncbi:DUF72 domain-containing protein [bacterium]|nr:DUF72 domain-containing protein [bacterium]